MIIIWYSSQIFLSFGALILSVVDLDSGFQSCQFMPEIKKFFAKKIFFIFLTTLGAYELYRRSLKSPRKNIHLLKNMNYPNFLIFILASWIQIHRPN